MSIISRKLFKQLSNWNKEPDRKPLLLRGARQVGKSYAVKEWCKSESLNLVTINFEEQPRYAAIFEQDLVVDRIIDEITTITGQSLRDPKAVLFLDEIQKAPKAIEALRYFYEKIPDVRIIAAGSLVEFVLEEHGLPVGRVKSHYVFPLSFIEFLEATERTGLAQAINNFSLDAPKPFSALVHQELLSALRLYYKIGGMPKVVATYLSTKDMAKVAEEQAILISGYRDDFKKYAKKADWTLLDVIFQKMGELAGSSPIKFSSIDPHSKSIQVRRALLALQYALIIHKILPSTADRLPLSAHAVDKRFKISFLDIGLLHYLIGFDWSAISLDADLTDINAGRFAEQFVGQELISSRSGINKYALHCWDRSQAGSDAEVDFVVECNNAPTPIEVKSGARGRLKSLDLYLKEKQSKRAYVLSQRNVEVLGDVTFLPLYLASRI